jgi:hypothetical protein
MFMKHCNNSHKVEHKVSVYLLVETFIIIVSTKANFLLFFYNNIFKYIYKLISYFIEVFIVSRVNI